MLFDLLRLYRSTRLTLRWNRDCANTGLMFQWRFDNYGAISLLYFFAREMYIFNLRSPGATKILREKIPSSRKVRSFAMDQVSDQPGLSVPIIV